VARRRSRAAAWYFSTDIGKQSFVDVSRGNKE